MNKFIFVVTLLTSVFAQADYETLGSASASFQARNPDQVLDQVVGNLKFVFEHYNVPAVGSLKVVSPLRIGGTSQEPNLQVTLKKCVFFACQTVALKASMKVREITGNCQRNIAIDADLSQSSQILTNYYRYLQFQVCYNSQGSNAQMNLYGWALQSEDFKQDAVQSEILKMLQQQVAPIGEALSRSVTELAHQ